MALIKCPECGRENVSDSAESCPGCGYGIKAHCQEVLEKKQTTIRKEKINKFKEKVFLILNNNINIFFISTSLQLYFSLMLASSNTVACLFKSD